MNTADDRRVIVIGSGPAGAMAAWTLVRAGVPVTMLESGSAQPHGLLVRAFGRNVFRRRSPLSKQLPFRATGDPETRWFHHLAPGGLSNQWTGAMPRFAPEDFGDGARLDERYRWPLKYEDLRPFYEQAEQLLGVVGDPRPVCNLPANAVSHRHVLPRDWQHVAKCATARGHGLTATPLADGPPWLIRRTSTSFNSFTRIVQGLRRSPNFDLLLGAHALQLEWSGAARRVTAVVYYDRATGAQQRVAGRAFVVAAGAISSTKLLLDSACADFSTGLGDAQGVLGRYLHDHPYDVVEIVIDRPLTRLGSSAYLTRRPYADAAPLEAAACILQEYDSSHIMKALALVPIKAHRFRTVVMGSVIPVDENRVTLDPTGKDPFGFPILNIHMTFGEAAGRTIATAEQQLVEILTASGHSGHVTWSYGRLRPGQSAHYGGTVRMHASPQYGVLNGWNRMHDVDNVVVADSSSFTTGPEKNPTLTIMALAARAADRLARDLKAVQVGDRKTRA